MIIASIEFTASKLSNEKFTIDDLRIVANQIRLDSSFGTFGEVPINFWNNDSEKEEFKDFSEKVARVQHEDILSEHKGEAKCRFELVINEAIFKANEGGLQKLLGTFSGDLFNISMPKYKLKKFKVTKLNIDSLLKSIKEHFRDGKCHSIKNIKTAFKLDSMSPLLAFSIKPRVGMSWDTVTRVAVDVASAGFNIVEFDTRYLAELTDDGLSKLLQLANEVASAGLKAKVVCRLSPNFSHDYYKAKKYIESYINNTPEPAVIKIDFSLDGISTLQAVRSSETLDRNPIITCYPLLKNAFSNFLGGGDTIINMLISSGVDIIYPGGCPQFTERGFRRIDSQEIFKGQSSYLSILAKNEAMPTVAGGVHAAELHAYYELLGPDVAYFIGGGVALHKDGPKSGAIFCKKIIDAAISIRKRNNSDNAQDFTDKKLSNTKILYHVASWMDAHIFEYLAPSTIFDAGPNRKTYFQIKNKEPS